MKKICAFILAAFAVCGCSNDDVPDLVFRRRGRCWQLSERQMDRYAGMILQASPEDARRLLDKGYSIADSIALKEEDGTLLVFADDIQKRFFDPNSSLRDDRIYAMALEREKECAAWTSFDQKRIAWAERMLECNAVGAEVRDIALGGHGETTLHSLIDRPVVLLLYGEECAACSALIDAAGRSGVLREKSRSGDIRLVSMYIGEDPVEFMGRSQRLDGWENYFDLLSTMSSAVVFDMRLIPSLYLISADKTVLVRGTLDLKEIESRI